MPGVCSPAGGEAALAERSGRAAADTEPARTARRVTCCIGFSGSLLLSACLVFFVLRSFTPLTRISSSLDMTTKRRLHHEAHLRFTHIIHAAGGQSNSALSLNFMRLESSALARSGNVSIKIPIASPDR